MADAVLRREAEFGINMAREHHPELASVPLTTDRYVLICHHTHPLAKRRRATWAQPKPYPLIFAGEVSGNRTLLDPVLDANRLALRSFYEVQRSSTAMGLVAQGVGIAVVPGLAVQEGAYPDVRRIQLVEPVVSRSLVLITRKSAHLSPAAQALYDMILTKESKN